MGPTLKDTTHYLGMIFPRDVGWSAVEEVPYRRESDQEMYRECEVFFKGELLGYFGQLVGAFYWKMVLLLNKPLDLHTSLFLAGTLYGRRTNINHSPKASLKGVLGYIAQKKDYQDLSSYEFKRHISRCFLKYK